MQKLLLDSTTIQPLQWNTQSCTTILSVKKACSFNLSLLVSSGPSSRWLSKAWMVGGLSKTWSTSNGTAYTGIHSRVNAPLTNETVSLQGNFKVLYLLGIFNQMLSFILVTSTASSEHRKDRLSSVTVTMPLQLHFLLRS